MTPFQKLGALLILLGEKTTRILLRDFDDREGELLAAEMATLPVIGLEQQTEVLREFAEWALQSNAALGGSIEYTRAVLEKTVGLTKAADIIGRIAPQRTSVATLTRQPASMGTIHRIVAGVWTFLRPLSRREI